MDYNSLAKSNFGKKIQRSAEIINVDKQEYLENLRRIIIANYDFYDLGWLHMYIQRRVIPAITSAKLSGPNSGRRHLQLFFNPLDGADSITILQP